MNHPAVLFLRVPPMAPERADNYEEWYDQSHIPIRMKLPYFMGAQRWDCLAGHPRYFVFYELSSVDALTSLEYLDLRRWEAAQPEDSFEGPGSSRPGVQRGVYEQRAGSAWPDAAQGATAILIAGYTPDPANSAAFEEWLDEVHVPVALETEGVTAVRRFQLTKRDLGPNSGMRTERPDLLVAYYLSADEVGRTGQLPLLVGEARSREQSECEPYELRGSLAFTVDAKQPLIDQAERA